MIPRRPPPRLQPTPAAFIAEPTNPYRIRPKLGQLKPENALIATGPSNGIPSLKSITFDQGSEWARWETLAATYEIDAWFCDPHSPWQRGQIENQNRAWRWWFPRGTDLAAATTQEVTAAADLINNQRRRNLDYQSPADLYAALTAH